MRRCFHFDLRMPALTEALARLGYAIDPISAEEVYASKEPFNFHFYIRRKSFVEYDEDFPASRPQIKKELRLISKTHREVGEIQREEMQKDRQDEKRSLRPAQHVPVH